MYPTTQSWAGCDTRVICKQSTAGLSLEFSFSLTSCITKAKEPNRHYYLPIIRFMPFPRAFAWSETQATSSRSWTLVNNSISYNNNCSNRHTSLHNKTNKKKRRNESLYFEKHYNVTHFLASFWNWFDFFI